MILKRNLMRNIHNKSKSVPCVVYYLVIDVVFLGSKTSHIPNLITHESR